MTTTTTTLGDVFTEAHAELAPVFGYQPDQSWPSCTDAWRFRLTLTRWVLDELKAGLPRRPTTAAARTAYAKRKSKKNPTKEGY